MKHGLSGPAIAVSAAYLVIAAVLASGQGYEGFIVGTPWAAATCFASSDTASNSIIGGSIIANALIVYLVVAAYRRLKADEANGDEKAGLLLLTKSQFLVFATVAAVVTSPFLGWTICGIHDASALILILPWLAGMPWVLLYSWLPFDIPGFTSAPIPDQSGRSTVTVFQLALLMLPVYLNIYIAVRLIFRGRSRE
jgi:hypothetical protein